MALLTRADLKTVLGITATTYDNALTIIVASADAAVKSYIRRGKARAAFTSWPESGADTEYYSGDATPDIILRYWPVTALASVYLDAGGYFGDGSSAFASTSLLTVGRDYVLVRDDATQSVTARIRRLGGYAAVGTGGDIGWYPQAFRTGSLVAQGRRRAVWPAGAGNIKVTYTAGYSAVPSDLNQAALQLATWLFKTRQTAGMPLTSESLEGYSYSLAQTGMGLPEMGSIRQLLSRWRETPI